ncbi:hypothetical protein, partial [Pseudomonas putida]
APERNREHSIGDQVSALNVGFMERLRGLGAAGENKKGPPFGEPFLILRMVRHQESKHLINI